MGLISLTQLFLYPAFIWHFYLYKECLKGLLMLNTLSKSTLLAWCRILEVKNLKMLSAATANYESETFPFHRCGGKVKFYSVQIYFGIAVENEKSSIFTFPIPYLFNKVKIRKKCETLFHKYVRFKANQWNLIFNMHVNLKQLRFEWNSTIRKGIYLIVCKPVGAYDYEEKCVGFNWC